MKTNDKKSNKIRKPAKVGTLGQKKRDYRIMFCPNCGKELTD